MSDQLDKIIITAMDRFVWFILLVVTSHLVTEFTRVSGIRKCTDKNIIFFNDSIVPEFQIDTNVADFLGQSIALCEITKAKDTKEEHPPFTIRPLIDGIFELPASTINFTRNIFQHYLMETNGKSREFDSGAKSSHSPHKKLTMREEIL